MPQFAPGETKTAIAPITARPSGMACEAELFLGPDELTKVATSGKIPFVSTGASQPVSLPIAMPPQEDTYHGYIDVFTNGMRFLAYKTAEDVTTKLLALLSTSRLGNIEILGINGKGFSEVGPGYAILSEPTVVSSLIPGADPVITWKNLSLPPYNPDGWDEIHFRFQYVADFPVSSPYDDAPQFYRRFKLPPSTGGIYSSKITAWYGGYWRPGIYNAEFLWGLCQWDQQYSPMHGSFTIKNMVYCTDWGHWGD